MGSAGRIEMVLNASFQTARAESTADICVKTGFEEEGAEFADGDRFFNRRVEDQGVCAGQRMHDIR